MNLTSEQHDYIAQRAQWYFDCYTAPRNVTALPDNVIFTGQGLTDLNRTIGFIAFNPGVRVVCEVGSNGTIPLGNAYPKYMDADINDVYQIKEKFIAFYGSVDRPDVYGDPASAAMMTPGQ